jgi:hypothetical protein
MECKVAGTKLDLQTLIVHEYSACEVCQIPWQIGLLVQLENHIIVGKWFLTVANNLKWNVLSHSWRIPCLFLVLVHTVLELGIVDKECILYCTVYQD